MLHRLHNDADDDANHQLDGDVVEYDNRHDFADLDGHDDADHEYHRDVLAEHDHPPSPVPLFDA